MPTPTSCLLAIVVALGVLQGCSPAEEPLNIVEKPLNLEQLDSSVSRQFNGLWSIDGPQSADDWGRIGQWFHVYDHQDSALRSYENAHAMDGMDPRWPYYLAVLAHEQGRLSEAMHWGKQAAALAPDRSEPMLSQADILREQGDYQAAQVRYQGILRDHPDQPAAMLGLAMVLLENQQPEDAMVLLDRLALAQPGASDVIYLRSQALSQTGQTRTADELRAQLPELNLLRVGMDRNDIWLGELRQLDVSSRTLSRQSYRAYLGGNFRQAAALAGQAASADPDNAELWINYAAALHRDGKGDVSLHVARKAIALDPNSARAYLIMGTVEMERDQLAMASRFLRRALELDPQLRDAHVLLGRQGLKEGNLAMAAESFARVRELGHPTEGVRFWHVAALLGLQQFERARNLLNEDLQAFPDDRDLMLLETRLLATAGLTAIRQADAPGVLETEAHDPDVFYAETAAMVAAVQGDHARAIHWQQRALDTLTSMNARLPTQIARRRMALYRSGESCGAPFERGELLIHQPVTVSSDAPLH